MEDKFAKELGDEFHDSNPTFRQAQLQLQIWKLCLALLSNSPTTHHRSSDNCDISAVTDPILMKI